MNKCQTFEAPALLQWLLMSELSLDRLTISEVFSRHISRYSGEGGAGWGAQKRLFIDDADISAVFTSTSYWYKHIKQNKGVMHSRSSLVEIYRPKVLLVCDVWGSIVGRFENVSKRRISDDHNQTVVWRGCTKRVQGRGHWVIFPRRPGNIADLWPVNSCTASGPLSELSQTALLGEGTIQAKFVKLKVLFPRATALENLNEGTDTIDADH